MNLTDIISVSSESPQPLKKYFKIKFDYFKYILIVFIKKILNFYDTKQFEESDSISSLFSSINGSILLSTI